MKKQTTNLFNRQKVLLALLQAFGGRVSNIDFQKYLFLYTTLCQKEKSYEFVPFKYGCFSFQSYADRRRLTELGLLEVADIWTLAENSSFLASLKTEDRNKMELFWQKYSSLEGSDLIREVYKKYPYYAVRSEIAADLMTPSEIAIIEAAVPNDNSRCFYTIGYEGKSFENYLNRLIKNNVAALVDVRKNPLSRKYGFSKKTLAETLNKLGIEYLHISELGIVSEKRQALKTQHDYDMLFNEYERTVLKENIAAIKQLYNVLIQHKRVAITCFEADVCMCHRGRVAKALQALPEWECETRHI